MADSNEPRSIGDAGEDFVQSLCSLPFGKDFLFRGQNYRSKNGPVELCDLLLLLDDTAILMEVKTADRELKHNRTDEEWCQWADKRLEKTINQIERGCNAILSGQVKTIKNSRQGRVAVDPTRIKHIFGVAVVDHPALVKLGHAPSISVDRRDVSVLTTTHEELQHILIELSTPGDFVDFLQAREAYFAKNMMLGISELDLLAAYKRDPLEFNRCVEQCDMFVIDKGLWSDFEKLEARRNRAALDQWSYAVDYMLDHLHESRHAKLPKLEEIAVQMGQPSDAANRYVEIAAEIARIRRIDRRQIGNKLLDKSKKCIEQKRDRWFGVAPGMHASSAFVFLVSTDNRVNRMKSLLTATWGGKLFMNVQRIIGIATEPITGGYGFSLDAFMIDSDPTDDRKNFPVEIQTQLEAQFGVTKKADDTEFRGRSE